MRDFSTIALQTTHSELWIKDVARCIVADVLDQALRLIGTIGFPLIYFCLIVGTIKRRVALQRQVQQLSITCAALAQVPAVILVRLTSAGYDPENLKTLLSDLTVEVDPELLPRRQAKQARKLRELSEKQKRRETKRAEAEVLTIAKELRGE